MKHKTLLDAACWLFRAGYRYDSEANRFVRGSWFAYLTTYNNGTCRTRSY